MVDKLGLELCDKLVDVGGCVTDRTKLLKDVILIQAINFSDKIGLMQNRRASCDVTFL